MWGLWVGFHLGDWSHLTAHWYFDWMGIVSTRLLALLFHSDFLLHLPSLFPSSLPLSLPPPPPCLQTSYGHPLGFDRTRSVEIGNKNIKLTHMEESYTSEHWLVRIYKWVAGMWPIEPHHHLPPPLSHPITTYLTHLPLAISSQRVKDLENREEITKPLRAVKNKRKVYPRKVCLEHSFCVALAVTGHLLCSKGCSKEKGSYQE